MVYKLSATLESHSSDVRSVCAPKNDMILSASRDGTATVWSRASPETTFTPTTTFSAGTRYVNAVTYIPPTPDAPKGYLVAGGQDALINVFLLGSEKTDPTHTLIGHGENVCTLDATPNGTIISGSWDKTARVWTKFSQSVELKGHSQSVWAVLAINDTQFLTGSADNTIKLWESHKQIHTFTGHTQSVRGLALVPDIGFASCSNDGEVRVWTTGGDVIYTLSGHTSFVYSVAVLSSGDIVSAGEDRSVKVWKDGECVQTIVHPAISVWTVATMPNGDIVSGCSDHVVRVFSNAEDRWTNEGDLKKYDDLVSSQALPAQQVGDVKKSDLPGPEALSQPGKKEGQVTMIQNNGTVEAHQWNSATSSWQKIGDVVDAVGSGRKQLYQGKEYDYVFDVDVKEGAPPLKLPYNASENPYQAALRFLNANDLPNSYIDQIVQFIEKNTSGVQLGGGQNEYVDPFTGASRYQASASSAPAPGGAHTYADPFTGAARYQGAQNIQAANVQPLSDPFTGGSRYSGTPGSTQSPPASRTSSSGSAPILPVRTTLPFKQANLAAMQSKIHQIHQALYADTSTAATLTTSDMQTIDDIFEFLKIAISRPSLSPSTAKQLDWSDVEVVVHVMSRWPESSRFPAIDLARLVSAYSPTVLSVENHARPFYEGLFLAMDWNLKPWPQPLPKHRETNILIGLRAVANAFQIGSDGKGVGIGPWNEQLFETLLTTGWSSLVKTHWVALATIAFNYSCVAALKPVDEKTRSLHLQLVMKILADEGPDAESSYRALVALGNVLHAAKVALIPIRAAALSILKEAVAITKSKHSDEERFRVVLKEVETLL